MIKTKNLYYMYDDRFVLESINLEIDDMGFTAIIGANGSGKSTLAKHFNGLLIPTKGEVLVDGMNTRDNDNDARKKVGFVFQNFEDQLIYSIAEEDVAFGLENLEMPISEIKKITNSTLRQLRINNLARENVNFLSSGQKQLVALAGVLAMKPKYIVFDEPTTMLDSINRKNIMDVIKNLNKNEKIGIILVTNSFDDLKYADNVVVLKKGRVLFKGMTSRLNKKILSRAGLYA